MCIPIAAAEFEELLKVVGDDLISAYRDKYFPARIIQACPNVYSIENAASWARPDKFCAFVARYLQEKAPPPTPSSSSTRGSNQWSDSDGLPQKRARALSLSTGPAAASAHHHHHHPHPHPPLLLASSSLSGESFESGESDDGTSGTCLPRKRKRGEQDSPSRTAKPSAKLAAGLVRVTRECWVDRVETTTAAPGDWRVPEAAAQTVAYVLDLTDDPHDYTDAKGKPLAMSAIIKHKCTDGWTGGSGGSLTKATTVSILGENVKCQKMSHECRGSFVCSAAAPDLWGGYRRYDRDSEAPLPAWPPRSGECDEIDGYPHIEEALRFYNCVVKKKCQFDNGRCMGRPLLKTLDQRRPISVHGKCHFVCCSSWTPGSSADCGHFSRQIPVQVFERVLEQLFETGRSNFSNAVVSSAACTFQVPPRTGLKQKQCPHVHVKGVKLVEGVIQHRPCPAKITIFSPIDHNIRKAVVIPAPGTPHNHPSHPSDKLTRRAKAALRAAGVMTRMMDRAACDDNNNLDHATTRGSSIDRGCLNHINGGASSSSSVPPLSTSGSSSSISTALMPSGYPVEHFY